MRVVEYVEAGEAFTDNKFVSPSFQKLLGVAPNRKNMSRNRHLVVFGLSFLTIVASAVPKPDEKRVLDHDFAQHMNSHDEHSKQFDHEQFLGEDQAKTFDQLAPEESRRRLG